MSKFSEQLVAAQCQERYLPGTATFIYQYITNMHRYKPIALAPFRHHPERFPFPDLFVPSLSWLQRFLVKVDRRLFHRQRLVDPFFRQVIQSCQVKLLHAHFGPVGVYVLPLRSSDLPLVTTFYGYDMSMKPQERGWRKSYRHLFDHGDLFLVEGGHMRDQLVALGCPSEKTEIQRIGVDLDRFSYQRVFANEDESVRILMCGTFREKKGHEYGIQAFARILSEFPRTQLRIIGDGVLRPSIERLIDELGLERGKNVFLLGYLTYDAYEKEAANAHIFMAPSVTASNGDSEGGAPTVLLEMQARGLPVLSTWHADIPEVVIDGASGYLVPERDVVALGEKLAELLAHPKQWSEMGRAGRAHIEKQHDIVKLAQELERKYDTVLGI